MILPTPARGRVHQANVRILLQANAGLRTRDAESAWCQSLMPGNMVHVFWRTAPMLDLRWLEDLATIAETRNLTRAAELRNVSQSGLSRRLQSLEHWAGVALIDRRKTPIELTEAGRHLLTVASDVMGRLNATRRAIRDDQDEKTRSVRFAAPHILSVTFFPKWLPTIQKAIGSTRLTILSDNLPGCCEAFDDGSVDFVVCFAGQENGSLRVSPSPLTIDNCQSLVVGHERLLPVSSTDSAGKAMHSLDDEPRRSVSYLGYSTECSLGWAVERTLALAAGLPQLNRIYENSLADGLRSMALSGLGVAWLPLSTTHQDILRGRLARTGPKRLDIDLEIRVYRPQRRLSRRAEDLWAMLASEKSVVSLPTQTDGEGRTSGAVAGGSAAVAKPK
jgi:LysR family transcriptional regulator, hypochlorite-specific transcription factor HypT